MQKLATKENNVGKVYGGGINNNDKLSRKGLYYTPKSTKDQNEERQHTK